MEAPTVIRKWTMEKSGSRRESLDWGKKMEKWCNCIIIPKNNRNSKKHFNCRVDINIEDLIMNSLRSLLMLFPQQI